MVKPDLCHCCISFCLHCTHGCNRQTGNSNNHEFLKKNDRKPVASLIIIFFCLFYKEYIWGRGYFWFLHSIRGFFMLSRRRRSSTFWTLVEDEETFQRQELHRNKQNVKMRAARRRQCFCRRVIYVWLQNIWRDAGGGGAEMTPLSTKQHISAHCPSCSHAVLFICLFSHSVSPSALWMWTFFPFLFFLICVIPELLLERQLAVWCSSLLIINASSQRELHKACQPIRRGFISCTTLFLRTPAQGRAGDPRKSQRRDQHHALRQFQRFRGGRQTVFLLHKRKLSMGSKMLQRWMEGFGEKYIIYIYIYHGICREHVI